MGVLQILRPITRPARITDLVATRSGADIVLSWSPITKDTRGRRIHNVRYRVYRATDTPWVMSAGEPLAETTETSYTDVGVLAGEATAVYYIVTAKHGARESQRSRRVGAYKFTLLPGANYIGLPLIPFDGDIQTFLGDQLPGTAESGTATSVEVWDPVSATAQLFWYCDADEWGEPWDNHWLNNVFEVSTHVFAPDIGYFFNNRTAGPLAFWTTGHISETDRVIEILAKPDTPGVFRFHFVTVSFPGFVQGLDAATAAGDLPVVGTCSSSTADSVHRWNPATQQYTVAWRCDCDAWGQPWDNHWLTAFSPTTIQLVTGEGYTIENRHGAFTVTFRNPAPDVIAS